ncbi:MAG TPA: hypothetical protein VF886_13030, partial [Roseiarcus sp.]
HKFAPFDPEPAWRRMFGQFSLVEYDVGHNLLLDNIPWLVDELGAALRRRSRSVASILAAETMRFRTGRHKGATARTARRSLAT